MNMLLKNLSDELLNKGIEEYESNHEAAAFTYFKKAASTFPNGDAEHYLFACFYDGCGTKTDKQLAYLHLAKSISLGCTGALNDLNELMKDVS